MKDIKFIIIIIFMFFGVGIMTQINDYDYSINNTGIMYQENNNIVLNSNNLYYDYNINYDLEESYLQYNPVKKYSLSDDSMKIKFNGTNQIEYINPYKFETIKINDINNVDNIEFELLNIENPVVFNWNITTNPDMPFVKFYNDETKLLYDFTDIKEINYLGNKLIGSRSNLPVVLSGAFDLIDMFYTGFQKLFNRNLIETISDSLKKVWPALVPNWPWLRR